MLSGLQPVVSDFFSLISRLSGWPVCNFCQFGQSVAVAICGHCATSNFVSRTAGRHTTGASPLFRAERGEFASVWTTSLPMWGWLPGVPSVMGPLPGCTEAERGSDQGGPNDSKSLAVSYIIRLRYGACLGDRPLSLGPVFPLPTHPSVWSPEHTESDSSSTDGT